MLIGSLPWRRAARLLRRSITEVERCEELCRQQYHGIFLAPALAYMLLSYSHGPEEEAAVS
jgi:hypothetical protein